MLRNLGCHRSGDVQRLALRAEALIANRAEPSVAVEPLIKARRVIEEEIGNLDRKVMKLARHDRQMRGLMTAPWVGPITALCFRAIIDDPTRFKRSRSVGAYVGLTIRRHASGEIDWNGRISKCGDAMLRSYLFEVTGVLPDARTEIVGTEGVGDEARQAKRAQES